jgi:hypothetical protein
MLGATHFTRMVSPRVESPNFPARRTPVGWGFFFFAAANGAVDFLTARLHEAAAARHIAI